MTEDAFSREGSHTGCTRFARKGCAITTVGWVVAWLAVWVTAALAVGLVVGRIVRLRERQVPRPPEPPSGQVRPEVPFPRRSPDGDRHDVDGAGSGRPGRS